VGQQGLVADTTVGAWLGGFVRILAAPMREIVTGADFAQVAYHGNWSKPFVAGCPSVPHEEFLAK